MESAGSSFGVCAPRYSVGPSARFSGGGQPTILGKIISTLVFWVCEHSRNIRRESLRKLYGDARGYSLGLSVGFSGILGALCGVWRWAPRGYPVALGTKAFLGVGTPGTPGSPRGHFRIDTLRASRICSEGLSAGASPYTRDQAKRPGGRRGE